MVANVIKMLESKFGKMAISCGKKHDFLGIMPALHDKELMEIDTKENIKSTIQDFGEDEKLKVACALARSNFFNAS